MVLDRQYLGALTDGDDDAREKARRERRFNSCSEEVIWEVYTGIGNASLAEKGETLRSLYERLLASRSTVDLSPEVSRRAGELNGKHMMSDVLKELDSADSIVAARGLLLDEPVVSNDSDFQDVEGLDVVTY